MPKILLDLGCGRRALNREGYFTVGIDKYPDKGVSIIVDLEAGKLPFRDNSIDHVYSCHALEHISNLIPLMNEVWRVLKPQCLLEVRVPYYKSIGAFSDPTHKRFFTEKTFNYFCEGTVSDYGIRCKFKLLCQSILTVYSSNDELYAVLEAVK